MAGFCCVFLILSHFSCLNHSCSDTFAGGIRNLLMLIQDIILHHQWTPPRLVFACSPASSPIKPAEVQNNTRHYMLCRHSDSTSNSSWLIAHTHKKKNISPTFYPLFSCQIIKTSPHNGKDPSITTLHCNCWCQWLHKPVWVHEQHDSSLIQHFPHEIKTTVKLMMDSCPHCL